MDRLPKVLLKAGTRSLTASTPVSRHEHASMPPQAHSNSGLRPARSMSGMLAAVASTLMKPVAMVPHTPTSFEVSDGAEPEAAPGDATAASKKLVL